MKARKLILSYGVTYASAIASVLLIAGFSLISLRVGTESYGALHSTLSFMFVLYACRGAAAGYVVLHAADGERSLGPVVRHAARLTLLVALLFGSLFFCFSPFLRDFLQLNSLTSFLLIGIACVPGMFTGMNEGILNVQKRFTALAVSSLMLPIANIGLILFLLTNGFQESDAGWIVLGGQCVGCLNALFIRWDFLQKPGRFTASRSALREVAELIIACILFGGSLRLDVLWAKHVLPPEQAGAYAIAASIAVVLYLVSNGVARVTSVTMRDDNSPMKTVLASYALILGTSCVLAGGFAAVGPTVLKALVRHDVYIDWSVLTPLFAALACYSLITFDFTCLNVVTKRVHVGIGVLLFAFQSVALTIFGTDATSIALTQCTIMAAFAIAFSISLSLAIRHLRSSPAAHPVEAHLQQA